MNAAERMLHDAHLRYQRRLDGVKRTLVGDASDNEIAQANQRRALQANSVHVESSVRKIAPKLNLSEAAIAHWCLNYYRYFCNHDRLLIERCTKCKRKGIVG